jgi:hypothetical protein
MTEHRAWPTGEYGSHPVPVSREKTVADRVDATVDGAQPARGDPMLDPSASNTKLCELCPCDQAILALRESPDRPIQRIVSSFDIHVMHKCDTVRIGSPLNAVVRWLGCGRGR